MDTLETQSRDRFLAEAETLSKLSQHPGWVVYTNLLTALRQDALEQLANCRTQDDLRYWQGHAAALKVILDRPEEIVQVGASILATEERGNKVRPEIRNLVGAGVDPDGDV